MATEDQLRDYLRRVTIDLAESRRRVAEVEDASDEPIAIVGMACRYPGGGETVDGFWDLLADGRSAVVEVPPERWNIDDYYRPDRTAPGGMYTRHGGFLPDIAGWDAELFGLPPQEALRMDPQQRLLMELVWEALESTGTAPAALAGSRTAVLTGFMDTVQYGRLQQERHGPGVVTDPYFGQGVSASVVAGRLAYQFDLRGSALTLDTACSSSLLGVHLGVQGLRRGECDLALAAGAFLVIQPDTYLMACATNMLSPDGRCKTFDRAADGYVMGEGGGIVVLERLSSALRNNRRIRAVIRGSAVNSDGRSNGLTAPSRTAQTEVIRRAQAAAKLRPADIDYLEAHGSGTQLGDAIELAALHDVFHDRPADRPLHVGAVKTNIGHTQAAAGVAGLIKSVLVLEHALVPPNLHLSEPSDAVPADGTVRPATAPVPLPAGRPRRAGVSSFGWSGTNVHVVLESAPDREPRPAAEPGPRVLPLSAANPAALRDQARQLSAWLAGRSAADLADAAFTLGTGRAQLDHRQALICADTADAVRQLDALAAAPDAARAAARPKVAFLLPGTGDAYAGLGRELYAAEPVFAAAVDECLAAARKCGVDLEPVFFAEPPPVTDPFAVAARTAATEPGPADPLRRAESAHPFLFTVEYALARQLAAWGVTADVLLGYSLGEYTAACLAGVFPLPEAMSLVIGRARLIAGTAAGAMLAAAADEPAVTAATAGTGADVAAVTGPAMTVLSGTPEQAAAARAALTRAGIACRELRTDHAFHSRLLAPAREPLAELVAATERQAPAITIVSNRTGAALTAEEATSVAHWADHLVCPVRFADGVRHCLDLGVEVFIELGAGQTLGGLVRQNLAGRPACTVVGTLPARWTGGERRPEHEDLLAAGAQLWEAGVAVDWPATGTGPGRLTDLPGYPFQRTRFWPEPTAAGTTTPAVPADGVADLCYAPHWRPGPRPAVSARHRLPGPQLPGPLVVFADPDGIGTALADAAEAAGTPVVEVVPGTGLRRSGRRIEIDPADPAHYAEIAAAVPADAPVHVVHLWSLRATPQVPVYAADDELRDAVRDGFGTLLLAVQALGDRPGTRLLTVSRGAVEILGADAPAPAQAAGHGLARVAQHEYPGLSWRGVDLDPAPAGAAEAAGCLAHELTTPDEGPYGTMTGWRRGRRWTQDWAEVRPPDGSPWREDGVYLITGGTRGLGLGLARHLVRSGVRRLALVSRGGAAGPETAELAAAGAEVLVLTADAGDGGQLRAALRECRAHFGALHGVIHAAGLPAGGMTQRLTPAGAGTVLAPKVLAMGPLAELVGPDTPAAERPELLVLYSSAITAFGGIGEADYCAANTVLDAYGAALAATAADTRVVTVAWGPWLHDAWQSQAEVPAGAGGLAERAGDYRRRYGFAEKAGCAFLDRMIMTGYGCLVAVRQPMAEALREWSALVDLEALTAAPAPATARFPRPRLRTEYVPPRTPLETTVAEVWQVYLGLERVGVHDPFFDLGGNSLVGMAMVQAVENELNTAIAPAVLFEHPTVAEFAAALDTAGGTGAGAKESLTTSAARGQRRRRARAHARPVPLHENED